MDELTDAVEPFLLHAAFGLVPLGRHRLPVTESDLPESFLAMSEDDQWGQVQQAVRVALKWGIQRGADYLSLDLNDGADRDVARRLGLVEAPPWTFTGRMVEELIEPMLGMNPRMVTLSVSDAALIEQFDTWETVVVWLDGASRMDLLTEFVD